MPITLVTGTPGAGKSLFVVKEIIERILPLGRPVYCNINGFKIPDSELKKLKNAHNLHIVGDEAPMEWINYPNGSFCIFDEIQRQYPYRNSQTKNPEFITGYETHRHKGMDFIFITQGPYLLDRHLHPLIDRHIHLYRPFGFKRSTILEWNGINPSPAPAQSRTNAIVKNFTFPKRYFQFYKSAVEHTVKIRFPWRLAGVFAAIALVLVVVAYFGWKSFNTKLLGAELRNDDPAAAVVDAAPECVTITAMTAEAVRVALRGSVVLLRRSDVAKSDDGRLVIGGRSDLAFPLCRVTQ